MKPFVAAGLVLVVIGLAGLVFGGITYTKSRDAVDLGVAELEVEQRETLAIHPVAGALVLWGGIVVTAFGIRRAGGARG